MGNFADAGKPGLMNKAIRQVGSDNKLMQQAQAMLNNYWLAPDLKQRSRYCEFGSGNVSNRTSRLRFELQHYGC